MSWKRSHITIIIITILLSTCPLWAQDISFKVTTEPDTALIGDEITVTIEAIYPKELTLSTPILKESGDIAVKAHPTVKSEESGANKIDTYTYTIAAFATGEVELPQAEFFYNDQSGKQNSRIAPIETVLIRTQLPPKAASDSLKADPALKDIIPPKSLPIIWWPYAVGAAVLILAGLAIWYYFKRKAKTQAIPEIPPEPPFDIAIRSLGALETKNLPGKGKFKEYYSELSEIHRRYIDGRFGIPAAESTTYELKQILKHSELSKEQIKDTLEFSTRADMIKFAKHIPETEWPGRDFAFVKKFVVETKPVEQIPEKAEVKK